MRWPGRNLPIKLAGNGAHHIGANSHYAIKIQNVSRRMGDAGAARPRVPLGFSYGIGKPIFTAMTNTNDPDQGLLDRRALGGKASGSA